MFDLIIHRRDAATDGKEGRGVKKWQVPDEVVEGLVDQLKAAAAYRKDVVGSASETIHQPIFLHFYDANTHFHFLALDTIREVELVEHR